MSGRQELLNHLLERVGHYRSVRVTGVLFDMRSRLRPAYKASCADRCSKPPAELPTAQRDALMVILGLGIRCADRQTWCTQPF